MTQEPEKKRAVLKFICPDCSRQRQEPIEHGITREGKVVKTKGGGEVRCKAAGAIKRQWERFQEIFLGDLINMGFYPSGKALYRIVTNLLDPGEDAFLVRNYSNARGVMETIGSRWRGPVGITRRYYFADKRGDKKEVNGNDFLRALETDSMLQEAIRNDPLLVAFPEGDVYLPWEI